MVRIIVCQIAGLVLLAWGACARGQELSPSVVKQRPESGRYVSCDGAFMVEHIFQIPGTDIQFDLVPIPPINSGRRPFWIGKCEVTLREYREFCRIHDTFTIWRRQGVLRVFNDSQLDAVTAPTEVYDPDGRFALADSLDCPALSMTQYSAKQYTKWLSLISKTPFRLPMETEWEHAASGGGSKLLLSESAPASDRFSAHAKPPANAKPLSAYANFDYAKEKTLPVGSLEPNGFGLFDMQGNVSEWVITKLSPRNLHAKLVEFPVQVAFRDNDEAELSTWAAKGGNFASSADECRIDNRFVPTVELWDEEANIPLSTSWLGTRGDPAAIGFRVVRLNEKLNMKLMQRYWNPSSIEYLYEIQMKIEDGRGTFGPVDARLPDTVQALDIEQPDWMIRGDK